MNTLKSPSESLELGQWFKLICGASYQDVSKIRNLSLVYCLAGADCIDVAADIAAVYAASEGIAIARSLLKKRHGSPYGRPWLMVSLNDGQDPHFRKAWFDHQRCPVDCDRPCERVCPADAILPIKPGPIGSVLERTTGLEVLAERCYGCGRCLPVCPHQLIEERSFTVGAGATIPALLHHIDAIEIHTQVGRQAAFEKLWKQLSPYISQLQLVAVSCPDSQSDSGNVIDYLTQIYQLMNPRPNQLVWQTDGRPMSGDIGKGTTLATIRLAQKVLSARLPGYVQLAGGTNSYTVEKVRSLNLLKEAYRFGKPNQIAPQTISGIAYGSYARQLVSIGDGPLEAHPRQLWQQVSLAYELVSQIKPNLRSEHGVLPFLKNDNESTQTSVTTLPP
ncbi:MAG: circadian clock protein LdpA [Leptolyngbyaceae cyanobacterium]